MKNVPSIFRADALVTDSAAMCRLLEPVPHAQNIRSLDRNFFVQVWDDETQRDYWLARSGNHVVCFTVAGVTVQQAAEVRAMFRPAEELSSRLLAALLATVTGGNVQMVQ